jgi:hypothetical protein
MHVNAPMPNHPTRGRARHAALLLSTAGLLLAATPVAAQSPGPASPPAPSGVPGEVGQIDHPTDPKAVVLRMETCCGFVPVEISLTEAPEFTLYGDNTVVFRPQPPAGEAFDPSAPRPAFVKATMTPAQVDALLSFALSQGGLQSAVELYANPLIADAPSTIFTVNAGGVDKVVTIQALGFDDSGPDAAIRAQFAQLADLLDSFEEQVAAGNVESAEPYQPERYRAILMDFFEAQPADSVAWPWDDLTIDDFQGAQGGGFWYAGLTPEQASAVTEIPSGGIAGIAVEAPDGTPYFLAIRPLLPDEDVVPRGVDVAA